MRAHDVALVAQIEELIETEVTELPAVDATIIALRAHAELQPQVVRAKGHGRLRPVKVVDKDGVVIKTGTTAELMQGFASTTGRARCGR